MSIKEAFSNTVSLPVTNESDQADVIKISSVLGHVYMFLVEVISET